MDIQDIKLKVEGISSLTDARYCAGMGVQKLGISFDAEGNPSLDLNAFLAVKGWIEGVTWTGKYLGSSILIFKELVQKFEISEWVISESLFYNLDLSELDGLDFCLYFENSKDLNKTNLRGLKGVEIVLGGSLLPENFLDEMGKINIDEVFLSGIPDAETIIRIHRSYPEIGFSLYSGEEERPGWMDLSNLQEVLERLEEI